VKVGGGAIGRESARRLFYRRTGQNLGEFATKKKTAVPFAFTERTEDGRLDVPSYNNKTILKYYCSKTKPSKTKGRRV